MDVEGILGNFDDPEGVSTPWIKTKTLPLEEYFGAPSLLWRTDVQCLALGILKMQWSPRGCLFDEQRGAFSRRLLCSAAPSLHALLEASYRLCETTTSPSPARINLTGSIKNLLPMCPSSHTSVFSRSLHGTLYDFEQVLNRDYKPDIDSMAIGIIFITSETFRKFVRRCVKEEDSQGNILTLDPNSKSFTIIAHGPFSNTRFVLDFDAVFNATLPPAPVSFTLEKVLFAALQACVRSLAFKLSLDSADLMNFVGQMNDVVYVSAIPNLPLSRRDRAELYHQAPHQAPSPLRFPSSVRTISTTESSNNRIPSDRDPALHIRFNQNESTESSAHPTRASSPGVRHADRLPRTIFADGVPYTRITHDVYSIHSGSEDQVYQHNSSPRGMLSTPERERLSTELELDHLESGIRSKSADATLQETTNTLERRISNLAPVDTALQERVDSLRATVN